MYKTPPGGEGGLLPAQGLHKNAFHSWSFLMNARMAYSANNGWDNRSGLGAKLKATVLESE